MSDTFWFWEGKVELDLLGFQVSGKVDMIRVAIFQVVNGARRTTSGYVILFSSDDPRGGYK